jgi:hypothetical protein
MGLRRAAVIGLPFTMSVFPMYRTFCPAVEGAANEPPAQADKIASAIRALAYFINPVVFKYVAPFE